MNNINEKPQKKGLDSRKREILRKMMDERYSINKNRELMEFISLYVDCEAIARKYVQYYRKDKNHKSSDKYNSLNYNEVQKSIQHFGLEIDNDLVEQIFKSNNAKRGEKTPRQLRNGILHSKSLKDIEEVEQRFDELSKLMEKWLNKSREIIHRL